MSWEDDFDFEEEDDEVPMLNSHQLRQEIVMLETELERKQQILKLTLELEELQRVRMMKILEEE